MSGRNLEQDRKGPLESYQEVFGPLDGQTLARSDRLLDILSTHVFDKPIDGLPPQLERMLAAVLAEATFHYQPVHQLASIVPRFIAYTRDFESAPLPAATEREIVARLGCALLEMPISELLEEADTTKNGTLLALGDWGLAATIPYDDRMGAHGFMTAYAGDMTKEMLVLNRLKYNESPAYRKGRGTFDVASATGLLRMTAQPYFPPSLFFPAVEVPATDDRPVLVVQNTSQLSHDSYLTQVRVSTGPRQTTLHQLIVTRNISRAGPPEFVDCYILNPSTLDTQDAYRLRYRPDLYDNYQRDATQPPALKTAGQVGNFVSFSISGEDRGDLPIGSIYTHDSNESLSTLIKYY